MNVSQVPLDQFSVFNTFEFDKRASLLSIQSKNGDWSMLNELPENGLAVVGTRYPQRRSVEIVEETLKALKDTPLIVISGFARGIDAKAHELAIESGLRTVAILGCGIDVTYPKENQRLREQIIDAGGLVISQFERDAKPLAQNFHNRNGVIAGLAKATWVVEAAEVSGTLNTAKWATEHNRDLYATSCFPKDHYYQGNVKLLNQRETGRYSIALSFFNSESLVATWPNLGLSSSRQGELGLKKQKNREPKTQIQRWILELQGNSGDCHIQTLMNYAAQKGITPGGFYKLFENDLSSGYLKQDDLGRVEVRMD